jgi:hypothetical protein
MSSHLVTKVFLGETAEEATAELQEWMGTQMWVTHQKDATRYLIHVTLALATAGTTEGSAS